MTLYVNVYEIFLLYHTYTYLGHILNMKNFRRWCQCPVISAKFNIKKNMGKKADYTFNGQQNGMIV